MKKILITTAFTLLYLTIVFVIVYIFFKLTKEEFRESYYAVCLAGSIIYTYFRDKIDKYFD